MGEEILVVEREVLFQDGEFEGFVNLNEKDYSEHILGNFEYLIRTEELEKNREYQQIIPYVWLVDPIQKKVFLYKREGKSGEGDEERLFDKYSGGVGGHIDRKTEEQSKDPIYDAMMRELKEEVILNKYPEPKIVGYINLNYDVHDVHFGVVGVGEVSELPKPAEGVESGDFYSVDEIESLFADTKNDVEEWTRVSWPIVRGYVERL